MLYPSVKVLDIVRLYTLLGVLMLLYRWDYFHQWNSCVSGLHPRIHARELDSVFQQSGPSLGANDGTVL